MVNTYFPARTVTVLGQLRARPVPSPQCPEFDRNGGGPRGYSLRLTAPNAIYCTTDGSDPRLPGGPNPHALRLPSTADLILDRSTTARRADGANWSALHEARFIVGRAPGPASSSFRAALSSGRADGGRALGGLRRRSGVRVLELVNTTDQP
jgi:hypothetical protein